MKYRLALKIDHPHFVNARGEVRPSGNGAIGWAVLRLKEEKTQMTNELHKFGLQKTDQIKDVCVVCYDNSVDMLEPMSAEQFEQRLALAMLDVPKPQNLRRVCFDKAAYFEWLGAREDSHQLRAAWGAEQ